MRDYFDQGKCGQNTGTTYAILHVDDRAIVDDVLMVGYIDVYNMTAQLAKHWPDDANAMTFDRVRLSPRISLEDYV